MITIVTGIPRSGTSMLMQMLIAGGMAAVYDTNVKADERNPNGYFEPSDPLKDILTADGKAIKVIVPIVAKTTSGNIIWITRNPDEVYMSETGHAANTKEGTQAFQAKMVSESLSALKDRNILNLNYEDVIANPTAAATQINNFLGTSLDVVKMAAAVNPALYRSKT